MQKELFGNDRAIFNCPFVSLAEMFRKCLEIGRNI